MQICSDYHDLQQTLMVKNQVFFPVNYFVLSVLTYSSSQLLFLSISPEAMRNISTLLESRVERPFSNARSPWLHLCHLHHACRQEPFLGCCFFPLGCDIQPTLTWHRSFLVTGRLCQITRTGWDSHIAQAVQIITYYFDISHRPPLPFSPRWSSQGNWFFKAIKYISNHSWA